MIRDPNCQARDLTKWFGWAFLAGERGPRQRRQREGTTGPLQIRLYGGAKDSLLAYRPKVPGNALS
jgi:hypothetical protein